MTERDRFDELARAIADRREIDWCSEKRRTEDALDLRLLLRLEQLDRLAEAHERLVHREMHSSESRCERAGGVSIGSWAVRRVVGEDLVRIVYEVAASGGERRRALATLIKWDIHLEPVLERHRAHASQLARVSDVRVAKLLDVGITPEGRVYFVHEHAEGSPITDHCDACSWSLTERASLVVELCRLVDRVHEDDLLHLGLRPAAVLLGAADGVARLHLMDLGIASAVVDEPLFVLLSHDGAENALDGFAPEQLGVVLSIPDRRCDVHGLGAILFELLAGLSPYRMPPASSSTERLLALRALRVPRPSESFVALAPPEREAIARARGLAANELAIALRRWDALVVHALARRPEHRPATAAILAKEVEEIL